MGAQLRRALASSVTLAAVVLLASPASADPKYRRPGLGGPMSTRSLTAPMNALQVTLGPGQPQMLGQRFDNLMVDAGAQYETFNATAAGAASIPDSWWFRGGIIFGLTDDWEAGALFLPFQFTPDFDFGGVYVPVTRSFRFENIDVGLRLSLNTPIDKYWMLSPGVPILWRLGPARVDASLSMPVGILGDDNWFGLNAPVRILVNANPALFFGLESGVAVPRFDRKGGATAPFGALAGYSFLLGKDVWDITGSFKWDNIVMLNPTNGVDTLQANAYRINFGFTYHSMVM